MKCGQKINEVRSEVQGKNPHFIPHFIPKNNEVRTKNQWSAEWNSLQSGPPMRPECDTYAKTIMHFSGKHNEVRTKIQWSAEWNSEKKHRTSFRTAKNKSCTSVLTNKNSEPEITWNSDGFRFRKLSFLDSRILRFEPLALPFAQTSWWCEPIWVSKS